MSVLTAPSLNAMPSFEGRWKHGAIILSDTHFGDLENGQANEVVALVHDAVRLAIEHHAGIIFNGDTFDYYSYSNDERRMDDSGILRSELHKLIEEQLPIAFVRGNHDTDLTSEDLERYTMLSEGEYALEDDFFMPFEECLVTHGHKVQLLNISKLTRRFHKQLAFEFGDDWHSTPPSSAQQRRVLELLSSDTELQKESDKIDAYYQNNIDHPEKRWRTRWAHGIAMFFQSTRGWLSAGLSRLAKGLSNPEGSEVQKVLLQWLASVCRLGLTHRALRFAKSLEIPMIVCGHNHVPQVEEEELRSKHGSSTHMYANSGSAYQRGVSNTLVHLERTDEQTIAHLLEHDPAHSQFIELDSGIYDRTKREVRT